MNDKEQDMNIDWRCQFCEQLSNSEEWKDNKCPKCGKEYNVLLAQDSEE